MAEKTPVLERAERLKAARKKKFRTASEAARVMGVSQVTYLSHESGRRAFDTDAAKVYAKRFDVDVAYLMFGEIAGRKEPRRDMAAEIYEVAQSLSESQQEKALRLLKDLFDLAD